MIDLDAYRDRLTSALGIAREHSNERAHGIAQARAILDEMRAAALPNPYDSAMPPMNRTPTSQAMRKAAWPRSGSLRWDIVRVVADSARGMFQPMTDDELENALGRSHQSVSAARNGLVRDGWLQPSKWPNGTARTAPTRSGNQAQVWEITDAAARRLRDAPVR